MNAYKSHSASLRGLTLLTVIVVSVLVAILLASALNSFSGITDSALADTAPTTGTFSQTSLQNAPRTTAGKNYLPIIFLNSATAGGAWLLAGNAGTNPATDFLGTTDNVTLTLRVNNVVGWRLVPSGANTPNVVGGYGGNNVSAGVVGATIGGGGASASINSVAGNYATVGGGIWNTAANTYATVGGGYFNSASNTYATIGGGYSNRATFSYATVGGGNSNTASNTYATVGGGYNNVASGGYGFVGGGYFNTASGGYGFVGGGYLNTASGITATVAGGQSNVAGGSGSFIGGGRANSIPVTATFAMIGGGSQNTVSGQYATVGGGDFNTAGNNHATVGGGEGNAASGSDATVGGGIVNNASGLYATVGGGDFNTAGNNYATVGGGAANTASGQYATVPGGYNNTASGNYSFAAGYNAHATHTGSFVWEDSTVGANGPYGSSAIDQFRVYATGGVDFITGLNFVSGVETGGCSLPANSGTWNCTSDRNVKANFEDVDPRDILARVNTLPIQKWKFVGQADSIRHIGPMAQDFYAAFNVGDDDKHIGIVDAQGVALAAIQGLNQVVQDKDARIATLEKDNTEVKARLAALEQGNSLQSPNAFPISSDGLFIGALIVGGFIVIGRRKRA